MKAGELKEKLKDVPDDIDVRAEIWLNGYTATSIAINSVLVDTDKDKPCLVRLSTSYQVNNGWEGRGI